MSNLVNITINNKELQVPSDYSILKAAESAGIYIPRLCFIEGLHEDSSCRVCVVEIEGMGTLKNSCAVKVGEGMKIKTNTKRVREAVKENLALTAANHVFECWACSREGNCEFYDLLSRYNVVNTYGEDTNFSKRENITNNTNPCMELNSNKCTLCGRCISACKKQAGVEVLSFNNRGSQTYVAPANNQPLEDAGCIFCGKCIQACPVAAIQEKDEIDKVIEVLEDPSKYVVIQAAPAVRAALGEEFGYPMGTNVEGKMYAAFNELGFDDIADTNWAADFTIVEEGTEFIHRLQNGGPFPMFTSCSPGWIRYLETYQPEYIPNLSSAKSPAHMGGSLIKHYFAEKNGKDPKNTVTVTVMPCIAKKYEAAREENEVDGLRDVDIVLTTREFARLVKRQGIDFRNLADFAPESPMAVYTGAAQIFGATGGVMEAALRSVVDILKKEEVTPFEYSVVRGIEDIKEASLNIDGTEVNIAVVHGGAAIIEFFEHLKTTDKQYHFVEFMACTGGCVNGGGQPIVDACVVEKVDVRLERAKALYSKDREMKIRKSHQNPSVMKVYEDFLGEPCGHTSHKLLHTHYTAKSMYSSNLSEGTIVNLNPGKHD